MQTYVAPPDLTINLEPESFLLRKFRSIIRNIVAMGRRDPRTVQHRLGHSDMKSTMCYLKASLSHVRGKVNEIPAWRFWTDFWLAISSSPVRKLLIPRHCGYVSRETGDWQKSLEYYTRARSFFADVRDLRGEIEAITGIGKANDRVEELPRTPAPVPGRIAPCPAGWRSGTGSGVSSGHCGRR